MGQGNHFKCSAILRHFEIRRRWKRMLKGLVPVMSHPKSRLFLACALSAGEISSTVFEFNCVEIRNCRLILWDCSIWFILSHILVSLIRAIYPPVDKIWFWALLPKLLVQWEIIQASKETDRLELGPMIPWWATQKPEGKVCPYPRVLWVWILNLSRGLNSMPTSQADLVGSISTREPFSIFRWSFDTQHHLSSWIEISDGEGWWL